MLVDLLAGNYPSLQNHLANSCVISPFLRVIALITKQSRGQTFRTSGAFCFLFEFGDITEGIGGVRFSSGRGLQLGRATPAAHAIGARGSRAHRVGPESLSYSAPDKTSRKTKRTSCNWLIVTIWARCVSWKKKSPER